MPRTPERRRQDGVHEEGQGEQIRAERDMVIDVEGGTPAGPEMAGLEMAGPARPEMENAGGVGDDAVDWSASDAGVGSDVGASDAEQPGVQDDSADDDAPGAPGSSTDPAPGAPTTGGEPAGAGGQMPGSSRGEHPAAGDPRLQGIVVAIVLGRPICKEIGRDADGVVTSVRFVAVCDLGCHACPRMRCRKRRESGAAQTSKFGEREPLAYLGAWLEKGMKYGDRDQHIAFKPSHKAVREFAAEHGLPEFRDPA